MICTRFICFINFTRPICKNTVLCVCRLIKIKEWVDLHDPGSIVIPFSGALELKLIDKDEADRASYLKELQTTRFVLCRYIYVLTYICIVYTGWYIS